LFSIPNLGGKVTSRVRAKRLGLVDIEKTNMSLFTELFSLGKGAKGCIAILVRLYILNCGKGQLKWGLGRAQQRVTVGEPD
jgi:hypothetical protein